MTSRARRTVLLAGTVLLTLVPVARAASTAPDGPGALSHFDLARKDCLGTSRTSSSKVWFTVAGGVLSDVYYPTVDNTNVETLQYIVTDGSTFTDLQTRDMTYTVAALGRGEMACRVTTTADSGRYRIVTDYVTDPSRNTLLMHVRFDAPRGYELFARLDPTVNGNGGGASGNGGADSATTDTSTGHDVLVSDDTNTVTNAANRDYGQAVYMAFDGPFSQVTSGFAGASSDGLTQLDAAHALTATYDSALGGNVVQVARIATSGRNEHARRRSFTLALGFGDTQASAVGSAEASLRQSFAHALRRYLRGWDRYDDGLRRPPASPVSAGRGSARSTASTT